jgi:hypothetical protein
MVNEDMEEPNRRAKEGTMHSRVLLTILCCWSMALAGASSHKDASASPETSRPLLASASFPRLPLLGCPVSLPSETPRELPWTGEPTYFGHDDLWTELWPDGRIVFEPGGPGFVLPDGSMGMKWPWIPFNKGKLKISGQRLDAPAAPLQSDIKDFSSTGNGEWFYPSYLIFPTPGCWQVSGQVGETVLTFVTLVVKIGDGPTWRPETVP